MQQEALNQLWEHGYVVAESILDDDVIESLRRELHAVVDETVGRMHEAGELPQRYAGLGFDDQLAHIARDGVVSKYSNEG